MRSVGVERPISDDEGIGNTGQGNGSEHAHLGSTRRSGTLLPDIGDVGFSPICSSNGPILVPSNNTI